jgi:MFS family permease
VSGDLATAAPAASVATSLRHNRPFRMFWLGDTVSQFGDRIRELALPLIAVTTLGATAAQVGALTAAIWMPNLLALFVGAWVDRRTRKRRLIIAADLMRAAALVSLPIAYVIGAVSFGQLLVVGLLTGAGQVLFAMAFQSFYAALVPSESYVDANSKLSMSRGASFVAGPAAGGALVQALSAPLAVVVDVASFLFSAVLIGRIRTAEPAPAAQGPSMRALVWDGIRIIGRHPVLRASLGCTATVNFFTFIASALLILFASRELGLSAGGIGIALGIGALGAVAGAAVAPPISRLIGMGPTAVIGSALYPAPMAVAAFVHGGTWSKIGWLAALELLSSIGVMLMDVNLNALITHVTPDDARGRRAGAYTALNYGIRPAGALVGGALGTAIGLRPSLVVAGVGGALAAIWLLASPVRRIATLADAA